MSECVCVCVRVFAGNIIIYMKVKECFVYWVLEGGIILNRNNKIGEFKLLRTPLLPSGAPDIPST